MQNQTGINLSKVRPHSVLTLNYQFKQLMFSNSKPKPRLTVDGKEEVFSKPYELAGKYKYSKDDVIGNGFTSTVYRGYEMHNSVRSYAIKVIYKKKLSLDQLKLIKNEIGIHPKLEHKNIVKCYDVFDTSNFIYLVMEECKNGDLAQYINGFQDKHIPEWKAIEIIENIVQGYRYLLKQGILHRDLKPLNIMRDGNIFKIADFGFAVQGKKSLIDSMNVGTPLYMPPQSIQQCVYSHRSDFFALGCILYQFLHGKTPWHKINQKALANDMKKRPIDLSKVKNSNVKHFIAKTCEISEGNRMSIEEFMNFDFRKIEMMKQIVGPRISVELKKQKIISKNRSDWKISSSEKTVDKSQKSQNYEEATFASSQIYFKSAKSEEAKKVASEFEESFEFCLRLKYLIENLESSIPLDQFDKKTFKIVLFKHCIFGLKKLISCISKKKIIDLKFCINSKQSQEYRLFEEECKSIKEKMEKQFNLQLKGMSLKNLSEVNKKFPELNSQFQLSKSFYQKMKQYLKELTQKLSPEIIKLIAKKSSQLLSSQSQNPNSPYFQTLKSLFKYIEHCQEKLSELTINKSMIQIPVDYNRQLNQQPENKSIRKSVNPQSQFLFFKNNEKDRYPSTVDIEKQKKKYFFQRDTLMAKVSQQNDCLIKQSTLKYHLGPFERSNTTINSYQLAHRTVLIYQSQRSRNQSAQSVQNHFAETLCKNYQQSKMSKEEFFMMKKKMKWL